MDDHAPVARLDDQAHVPRLSVVVPATNEPPTLGCVQAAIEAALTEHDELIIVRDPPLAGPAQARNAGAERAVGEILVFIDADVEMAPDALDRIRAAFTGRPDLTALFGSYDDHPAAPGTVSNFRNLLHHQVHHDCAGAVKSFWAGLGAVRRDAFLAIGGFDAVRFAVPSVEDIELGMRLADAGGRIELDPTIQGTHLKHWTFVGMVSTDFQKRGIPWVDLLMARRRVPAMLNLGWRHRLSAFASVTAPIAIVFQQPVMLLAALVAMLGLNHGFYTKLARCRGPFEAGAGVMLHTVHHLTAVASLFAGVVVGGVRRF